MGLIAHRVDTVVRPQPLGLFDGPAGLLVVPAGDGAEALVRDLACGRIPQAWPECAAVLAAAVAGDTSAAVAALGDGPEDTVNRLVLAPTPAHLDLARRAAAGDPVLATVVAAAAYVSGLSDTAPVADGLIVGSALVRRIAEAGDKPRSQILAEIGDYAAELISAAEGQ